ncbi:MAG TPA: superoxide dismutase [Cu-Zn] SodC [Candidatus Binataceae bacterium]|nr:superoxide dismutase [Cu-Zn] SodC [Candidatus Binataceae bacterium]
MISRLPLIASLSIAMTAIIAMMSAAHAAPPVTVTVNSISAAGVGPAIGSVTFADSKWGLLVTPNLSGLPAGVHGFHIHEKPACGPADHDGKMAAGFAAGGHLDPAATRHHKGPYGNGHAGDLPPLVVNADGKATTPVLAPRLLLKDVQGRAIMVHAGGDNYADEPEPLGGGGPRIACGVIP